MYTINKWLKHLNRPSLSTYHIYTMVNYECDQCKLQLKTKQNLENHNNKNSCKERTHICKFCEKTFTTAQSMYRHIRTVCDMKKQEDSRRNEIFERLIKIEETNELLSLKRENELLKEQHELSSLKREIEFLKENNASSKRENGKLKKKVIKMEKLIKSNTGTINNNLIMNVNNGVVNNNNVTLVAYGLEDMSKLDKIDMANVFQNGYNSTLKLTETLHFNPKYPEYHNVYIPNMKDKYAMMYDGSNWALTIKEDLINKIYNDKRYYIEENLDDFLGSLSSSQVRALNRWLDTEDDDSKIKNIKERIKLLLYNSKYLPIEASKNKVFVITDDIENLSDKSNSNSCDAIDDPATKNIELVPGTKRKYMRKVIKNK
jgi:hypothetical protein